MVFGLGKLFLPCLRKGLGTQAFLSQSGGHTPAFSHLQAALRPKLKKLHIVIERPILPSPDEEAASSPLEEVPLLHQPESSGLPPLAHRERLQLVPDGTPEVRLPWQELVVKLHNLAGNITLGAD